MSDINNKFNLIPDEAITKIGGQIYKDLFSPSFQQTGKAIGSLLKCVALPFTFLGMKAEQLEERYRIFLKRTVEKVPEEKRTLPKASIVCPLLDHVKFCFSDDESILEEMFFGFISCFHE